MICEIIRHACARRTTVFQWRDPLILFRKEILIKALKGDGPGHPDADAVFDHQPGKAPAVDQDDALLDAVRKSRACCEKVEVVTNTPFVAPCPTRLPTKACTSGRPTTLPGL